MGAPLGPAECVVYLERSYPREDPSCSGPVPTAKTTLNPAHVRPERRALHKEPRLDDTITATARSKGARKPTPSCGVDPLRRTTIEIFSERAGAVLRREVAPRSRSLR